MWAWVAAAAGCMPWVARLETWTLASLCYHACCCALNLLLLLPPGVPGPTLGGGPL